MRDEEMPHDRLELLHVRRTSLGRRLDRRCRRPLPPRWRRPLYRRRRRRELPPPARARSHERGSPRRCARGCPRRRRRRGSRPATERRDVRSHASNLVSHPSSFVRAVISATLSVGAYASKSHSFRKSLTACEACAAPPPTPRMKSRPCRRRTSASAFASSIDGSGVDRSHDLADLAQVESGI